MLAAMESAIEGRSYVLGDDFSMADVVFGGTVRFMLSFKMLEPRDVFVAYADRLAKRPALQKADAINATVCEKHGIKMPGG